jgi:hypothetical protein
LRQAKEPPQTCGEPRRGVASQSTNQATSKPFGASLDLNYVITRLSVSFNAYVRSSVYYPSDLPGFDRTTYYGMILYYHLMIKVN